ncbi:MAG TPA: hypothetical protein VIL35_15565 [Vicinamibacterales bacterium]
MGVPSRFSEHAVFTVALVLALLAAPVAHAAGSDRPRPEPAAAPAIDARDAAPVNLLAGDEVLDLVARMRQRSDTFHQQCARIARTPGLVIRIRIDGPVRHGRYRARSVIRRHEYGAMIVDMTLHAPLNPVEVLGHEFEHVLEQLDRVDLQSLSGVRGSGVVRIAGGDYETRRAVQAGRRVAEEYEGAGAKAN